MKMVLPCPGRMARTAASEKGSPAMKLEQLLRSLWHLEA